jgi:hypothetical protein
MGEVVCVVMRLRVRIPWEVRELSVLQIIRPESWVYQPPVQWVAGFFFYHLSLSSAKVTNEYNYVPVFTLYVSTAWTRKTLIFISEDEGSVMHRKRGNN